MFDISNISIEKISESKITQTDFDNLTFGRVFSDHMFVADYKDGEWTSPRIVPYQKLAISPANATLHYAQSIFEGLKAYKDQNGNALIFRPEANWARMNESAKRMCMPEIPEEIFIHGLEELIKLDKNWIPNQPGYSLYIRPFMFATDEYVGIRPSDTYKFIIFTCPVSKYYAKPVRVKVETKFTRAFAGGTGYAKAAGNYGAALYPARQAQNMGYDQLIWTDGLSHSKIEESGTMNVMFIINDTLITAPTDTGTILKGITRDSVLTLARDKGLKVEERSLTVEELYQALENGTLKEAFGTGTAATIANIELINLRDKDYTLPTPTDSYFSKQVYKTLDQIKTGQIPDKFDWIKTI